MKTKSSAKKRFRVRPGGTVKRGKTSASCAVQWMCMRPIWVTWRRCCPLPAC